MSFSLANVLGLLLSIAPKLLTDLSAADSKIKSDPTVMQKVGDFIDAAQDIYDVLRKIL